MTLNLSQMAAYAYLDDLGNHISIEELEAAGIDTTPGEAGDCFGAYANQEAWAELDTTDADDADETRPADARARKRNQTAADLWALLPIMFIILEVYPRITRN